MILWTKDVSILLIAACIRAARKLSQWDGGKRVPATVSTIADAVRWAERGSCARIDERKSGSVAHVEVRIA